MPSRVYRHVHALRRRVSRSRFASWLLGRERPSPQRREPGLVMLQIDGLSYPEMMRAVRHGRMPYLRKLILRDDHELRSFYSGLPSATPAVQGEIFFGVPTAVPSFGFFSRSAGVVRRMFSADSARAVGESLCERAQPLLEGGASYSNVYIAGAERARFCGEQLDLPSFFRGVSRLRVLALFVMYFPRFLHIAFLGLVEAALALVDCARGLIAREDLVKELKFVPTRVGVCVVLRELIEFQVRLDIQEGLPVIHANLLGYDEQAHRRGPDSRFAHWTLGGIDKLVRNISRAAARSQARDYELVVYSDHGQAHTVGYELLHGRTIEEAVRGALAAVAGDRRAAGGEGGRGRPARQRGRAFLRDRSADSPPSEGEWPVVSAMGPIGQVYHPDLGASAEVRRAVARELVDHWEVPLVWHVDDDSRVWVERRDRSLRMPDEVKELFVGADEHPFLPDLGKDIVRLARHADAGDLVLSGWRCEGRPVTFAVENGSHGGIGPRETHGFAVVPGGMLRRPGWVRGRHLYQGARRFLGTDEPPAEAGRGAARERGDADVTQQRSAPVRVMTYNIHSCIGMDGRVRPERVARVIANAGADLVALQEVDVRRARSRLEDQTEIIAEHLGMHHHFLSLLEDPDDGEEYGIAVLSRFPFEVIREGTLTEAHPRRKREARGAIWVRATLPGGNEVDFVSTHFGLGNSERLRQAEIILGPGWLGERCSDRALILCGDFNSSPGSRAYNRLTRELDDVVAAAAGTADCRTFVSVMPLLRIDHIFATPQAGALGRVLRPTSRRARLASDHLPLCADFAPYSAALAAGAGARGARPASPASTLVEHG